MEPIGVIHSPFREKFGVPRQGGLVPAARGRLELYAPFDQEAALVGLEEFSHLWLIFVFHQTQAQGWKPTVRPPRLGGNARVGVFASRSPFRPNALGLSAVALHGVSRAAGKTCLHLGGLDLVDGTPVLDVKPYLAYADSLPEARSGFASRPPASELSVEFTDAARAALESRRGEYPHLQALIEQVLRSDPRPAYRQGEQGGATYGMRLLDFDLRWCVDGERVLVQGLVPA